MEIDAAVLDAMMAELEQAPRLWRPSAFWERLSRIHAERIAKVGLLNFKRSINLKYFNWRISAILAHQLWPVAAELVRGNFSPFLHAEFPGYAPQPEVWTKGFNSFSAYIYKVFVAMFADYVSRRDVLRLLEVVEEPELGNPFSIIYRGRRISQDLLNSILEFYSATEDIDPRGKIGSAAEIGAGYGRLAYAFMKALPRATYCIVDIPPALFVSQTYLSQIFPGERIFRFRPFGSFGEVRQEFESSRIRFLMAHQIELLPPKYFDLILNVSSLHEMTRDQIANYIRSVERIGRRHFYTKQWKRSHARDNNFITEHEYPIPAGWQMVHHRTHPVQRPFFEALYRARAVRETDKSV